MSRSLVSGEPIATSLNPNQNHKELLYKVLVVGDVSTGKTSIIKRYVHGIYSIHYKATIGVDFALKVIKWDDNTNVRLQLWDLAGQERFANMTRVYYKESVGAFIVFDVTHPGTFDSVRKWKLDIDQKVTLPNTDDPIPVVLIINKIDLLDESDKNEQDKWSKEKMDKFCEDNGFVAWFKTSAKDGVNIDNAANALVKSILDKLEPDNQNDSELTNQQNYSNSNLSESKGIRFVDGNGHETGQSCCYK